MKILWSTRAISVALLFSALALIPPLHAQSTESATRTLLDKANVLELRGRMDLAAQTWQQILLADPNNVEALAGLARSAKLSGNAALAGTYIDRLRAISPNDANLGRVPKPESQANHAALLQQAAKHNDPKLAYDLRNQPKLIARVPQISEKIDQRESSRARSAEEQSAYAALNGRNLPEAELRFKSILSNDPNNARTLAGMGYVRMQQSDFAGAITFLENAKRNGARGTVLENALEGARFCSAMRQGSAALTESDLTTAEQQYRAALALRPSSTEALEGLGETFLKAQQPEAAVRVFEHYVVVKPASAAAWSGLFRAQYGSGNAPGALMTEGKIPAAVHAQLLRDPDFLRTLASAYSDVGADADAQRALHSALQLPFPPGARGLEMQTQLQYAALLQQANRLDQAAGLYKQVLQSDPTNTAAWQGLVRVQHTLDEDPQALQALQAMPPSSYDAAMRDSGFRSTVAAIYQSQNKLDIAQGILEKSVAQQTAADQKPSTPVLLQLAGIYLQRNGAQEALPIYRTLLTENPDRPDAWKSLLSTLHTSGRDQEALAQIQQIPPVVRSQLEGDVDYLQTVAAVYNSLGQPQQAMVFLQRVQQHHDVQRTTAPADIDIQDAWLLFNGGNDSGLYRQLMTLGERQDLTDEQRRAVQTIWTNWAVRRARQAAAAGNVKRSLAILNAAASTFPDSPGVLRELASGYARAGLPRQAVLIFKSQDMSAATSSDYKSAVDAALSAGDVKIAETWLRLGLDAYPKDSEMLMLAARFEQARGNSTRAADYYRSSLAALPPSDPGTELAAELSQPEPVVRLPGASQPQELGTLLGSPDGNSAYELAGQSHTPIPAPYLPMYGNAYSQSPIQIQGQSSVVPLYMANPSSTSSQDIQRQQVQSLSGQPQTGVPNPKVSDRPVTTQPNARDDVYGPYVPYVGPMQSGSYSPLPQTEATNVLPTARHMPKGQPGNRETKNPGRVLARQSNPPPDSSLTLQNGPYVQQPQQHNDGYGQQYPQPGPYRSGTTAIHHRNPCSFHCSGY